MSSAPQGSPVICVDLDGCLVKTDLLHESLVSALRSRPYLALALPLWLLRGRAYFKAKVGEHGKVNPASLPYNSRLVEYLKQRKAEGARLILATAANGVLAHEVAQHLGLFEEVIASDAVNNLKGAAKARAIAERLKGLAFVYAGNSSADLAVWECAGGGVLVNAPRSLRAKAERVTRIDAVLEERKSSFLAMLQALRLHQWSKNLLVFVPLVTAHKLSDASVWTASLIAFFSFCLCASAVYLINDFYDLEHDRQHATKRLRPLAAGDLSSLALVAAVAVLLGGSVAAAALLPEAFRWMLFAYFVAGCAYSIYLKRLVIIDVILLASLYTFRIVAGMLATGLALSHWLLAFSMFLFFSLALMKRYVELRAAASGSRRAVAGRGYLAEDHEALAKLGTASGYMAVVIFALYINSDSVKTLYSNPAYLWLACPLILYWASRAWIFASRGVVQEDPILFLLKDPPSYVVVALVGVTLLAASFAPSGG